MFQERIKNMAQRKTYDRASPEGMEILARQKAREESLDAEAAPRHAAAEAAYGIDAVATDRTMALSPWDGKLRNLAAFLVHREDPNRSTPPFGGLDITYVNYPAEVADGNNNQPHTTGHMIGSILTEGALRIQASEPVGVL